MIFKQSFGVFHLFGLFVLLGQIAPGPVVYGQTTAAELLERAELLLEQDDRDAALLQFKAVIEAGSSREWEAVYSAGVQLSNLYISRRQMDSTLYVLDQVGALADTWRIPAFEVKLRNYQGQTLKMLGQGSRAIRVFAGILNQSAPYPEHVTVLHEYAVLKYQLENDAD
ncbi:MAG: hypothetical protein R3330_17040, partial [Saprospiraceae bacterium]|nr:hypothetical protein [Saprospiraceae bacterium]